MKISVVGAGAIGSWFGGLLAEGARDLEVRLIARGAHGEAMATAGHVTLVGRGKPQEIPVRVTESLAECAGSDIILFTVKSQQTAETISALAPFLGDAIVVSIQNGINQPQLLQVVPAEKLVVGMTATNMAILSPGTVTLQRDGATVVGPGSEATSRSTLEKVAALLARSTMRISIRDQIVGAQYNKLVFNTMGCAASLSRTSFLTEAIIDDPWRKHIALPLHAEALRIFREAGVSITRTPSLSDVHIFGRMLRLLGNPVAGRLLKRTICAVAKKPLVFSVQLDLDRGRPTEVDFINGEIVRLARSVGSQAPFNELVVNLVRELEGRSASESRMAAEEVISHFRSIHHN